MRNLLACFGTGLFCLVPFFVFGQEIPPERTIETTLPEKAPERVVELMWLDGKAVCTDTLTLSLSAVHAHANVPVRIRMKIRRKCSDGVRKDPVPVKAELVVRGSTKRGNANVSIVPSESSFSFEHTFPSSENYQVSVISYYSEEETHTVSVKVPVWR